MRSSQAASDLIVAEEVTSEAVYKRKYRKPEWPGEQSGATVGIGYDLGQTSAATIRADWSGRVSDEMLAAMVSASGKTGAAGKAATAKIRNSVDIPWDVAIEVHRECVVPRWEAKLAAALPNTDKLSPDCFGALLSLTFNRGPSFSKGGARYAEMRAIKAHMKSGAFDKIPAELRAMKRIWPNSSGLRRRRDREAELFESGLRSTPPHNQASDEIRSVQRRLDTMGYHNVGLIDGKWGGSTAAAIAAFKNDRHVTGDPVIDADLLLEMDKAESEGFKRAIAPARAQATEDTVAKQAPEIVPVKRSRLAALWATVTSVVLGIANALADYFKDALSWVVGLKEYAAGAPGWVWWALAAVVAIVIYFSARNGAHGIVEAFRKGERS